MATSDPAMILRVPGQICVDPTDLSTAFPHGGTALGVVSRLGWEPRIIYDEIVAQEWGGVVSKVVYAGESPMFYGILRSWDNDLMQILFRQTAAGTVSGSTTPGNRHLIGNPDSGTPRPGTLVAGRKIVFSPMSPNEHPFLILYNAKPKIDVAARMELSIAREWGVPFALVCTPDATGRLYHCGLRDDPETAL